MTPIRTSLAIALALTVIRCSASSRQQTSTLRSISAPSRVFGLQRNAVTVLLTRVAPPGGITLTISTTGQMTAPSEVVVPAGTKVATFDIVTPDIGMMMMDGSITVSTASVSITKKVSLQPMLIKSATMQPASVVGGAGTSLVTFILRGKVDQDVTISTWASLPVAQTPPFIVVPAGQDRVTFQVTTSAVRVPMRVKIDGFRLRTFSSVLTVLPN